MNYNAHTIELYLCSLTNLSKFYNLPPDQLSVDQIKDYLHYCITEKNRSVGFINQTISALKILYVQALGRDWEGINIRRPRKEKTLPVILTQQEIGRILAVTTNMKHKSILTLAYSTGMRLNEVRLIKPSEIDATRLQVKVSNGKGNKQRHTIISEKVIVLLRDYYIKYRPIKYLFEGPQPGVSLVSSTLRFAFNRSKKKAGIEKDVTFHSLRHSFATHLLEQGTNLKLIQRLLDHHSLGSTMVYLHVANTDMGKIKNPIDLIQEG